MSVTLNPKTTEGIMFSDVNDGQLVQILHSKCSEDIGKIAQRSDNDLVIVGEDSTETYEGLDDTCELRLRVLLVGETMTVTDNEGLNP